MEFDSRAKGSRQALSGGGGCGHKRWLASYMDASGQGGSERVRTVDVGRLHTITTAHWAVRGVSKPPQSKSMTGIILGGIPCN